MIYSFGESPSFSLKIAKRYFRLIPAWDTLEAVAVGALPEQLAVLINTTARCEELAVQAALEGDARKAFWACAFDPLTSAVLSLDEIQQMVNEMLEQNKDYIPWYKRLCSKNVGGVLEKSAA